MGTDGACGLLFCAAKRSGSFPPNMPAGLRAFVIASPSWGPALCHHGRSGYQLFSLVPNPDGCEIPLQGLFSLNRCLVVTKFLGYGCVVRCAAFPSETAKLIKNSYWSASNVGNRPLRLAEQKSRPHAPSVPMCSAPAYFLCKWGV